MGLAVGDGTGSKVGVGTGSVVGNAFGSCVGAVNNDCADPGDFSRVCEVGDEDGDAEASSRLVSLADRSIAAAGSSAVSKSSVTDPDGRRLLPAAQLG